MLVFLNENDQIEVKGSGKNPYIVKKVGGVVSCSCPAWRNFGGTLDTRTCKHIKANIDPSCLSALAASATASAAPVRLTKTGKISTAVSGVVKKETAPPCFLAHSWDGSDPTGWYMSEKLDGVRVWWDGENLWSRYGNIYHAPEWFLAALPKDIVLDGELWGGRANMQKTVSSVRKMIPNDDEWQKIVFMVFDAPKVSGTFSDRYKFLQKSIQSSKNLNLVKQESCESEQHLKQLLADVEAEGGEGVMIRDPKSLYEEGRSWTCQKVKSFSDDEAEVLDFTKGRGKYKDLIGALVVKWNNKTFELGTGLSDSDRRNPPEIGSKVTFRYRGLTDEGVPRNASYVTKRNYE